MVYSALKGEEYVCYLGPETVLPFAYVDDMISETVYLLDEIFRGRKIETSKNNL